MRWQHAKVSYGPALEALGWEVRYIGSASSDWMRCAPWGDDVHLLCICRCAYCDIPYDVIGKMETFDDDLKYIATVAGISDLILEKEGAEQGVQLNMASNKEEDGTLKYFRQLNAGRKKQLCELYQYDFDMFGYSPDKYL